MEETKGFPTMVLDVELSVWRLSKLRRYLRCGIVEVRSDKWMMH